MRLWKRLSNYLFNPDYRFIHNASLGLYNSMEDEKYIKRLFKAKMGYPLDLNNPKTFNEKLQWLKLHDRNDIYTTMVDKYAAKQYVSSIIGEKYIIPTLGVWEKFEDIDFSVLPDQFVLKTTHDSGGVVICKDKSRFDFKEAQEKINSSLKSNFYYQFREWPYKNVKPRIIAEEYMEDESTHELRDYKFFTFGGVPKALFIATERNSCAETKFDFFDADYNHLPITNGHPNADVMPSKPQKFEEMKMLAAKLSQNIPQLRVDFYEANGRVYFGELTFAHWGGFVPFEPKEWDKIFGEWILLPKPIK